MTTKDVLYKETLIRVGAEEMIGIDRLLSEGHKGIAEKHTVQKLILYTRNLEKKLGIDVPRPEKAPVKEGLIKVNAGGAVYYAQR